MMSTLSDLPNVGKVLEDNLRKINIETPEQLRQIGAEEAFFSDTYGSRSWCVFAYALWHSRCY